MRPHTIRVFTKFSVLSIHEDSPRDFGVTAWSPQCGKVVQTSMCDYRFVRARGWLTEIAAAIARAQLERLPQLNLRRLELVEQLYRGLIAIPGLDLLKQDYDSTDSLSTYYVAPLKFTGHSATRNEVAEAFLAEGVPLGRGYVKPLYLQPLYQRKHLFPNGYPFSAPPNVGLRQEYGQGICPVAEQLHYCEVLINEHVRPPQTEDDVDDILKAAMKIFGNGD